MSTMPLATGWVWRSTRCCSARTATPSADAAGIHRDGEVPAGYLYVDGTVGDVSHGVLRDRRVLAEEGVVMVVATVTSTSTSSRGCPRSPPGWVHAPEAEGLLEEASQLVRRRAQQAMVDGP